MDLNLIYHSGTIFPRYADICHIYLTYSSRISKLRNLPLPFLHLEDPQASMSPTVLSSIPQQHQAQCQYGSFATFREKTGTSSHFSKTVGHI